MDQSNRGIATSAAGTDEDVRLTYDVPEAGRLLGLSRNGAYAAAKAGLIPVLNIGGRKLVPKAALHQMLAAAGLPTASSAPASSGTGSDKTVKRAADP